WTSTSGACSAWTGWPVPPNSDMQRSTPHGSSSPLLKTTPAPKLRSNMSTEMNSLAGKSRIVGANTWLVVLAVSVLILGLNVGYATYKASLLSGASASANSLQVLSQRLAVQGREAVGGDDAAYTAFKATKG